MKKLNSFFDFKSLGVHLGIGLLFVLLSLAMFYPLLQGKKLFQSDTAQYSGMARQLQESREKSGEELYWIDNAFGGMPTYQLGAKYPYDVLTPLHKVVRLLPHPSYLLFLYFLGAYVFLLSIGQPKKYAILGALAYGLSTYLLIIIQVGHNTKAQALGYLPFVFAAMHYIFSKKSLWGIVFGGLAMAMQIRANHYQMTYYMLLLMGLYVGFQAWQFYQAGKLKPFLQSALRLTLAGVLAIALNATALLATSEYTQFSTRGKSELTQDASGLPLEKRSGLSYDYITQYSYGIFESFNLMVPRIQGGGSGEDLGSSSAIYKDLIQRGASRQQAAQFAANVPTYWGDQPILEAPAYIGIVVVFLAVLALFFPLTLLKKWLCAGIVLSLLLSWGKNFDFLTRLFIDYFPLYSKFRAVSSIQVILEFCFPILAILGLKAFFDHPKVAAKNALKKALYVFGGVLLSLYLAQGVLSFQGPNDSYYSSVFGSQLMQMVFEARKDIYAADLIRAIVFVLLVAGMLYAFLFDKLRKQMAFIGIGLLLFIDLLQISNRYLDRDLFVPPSRVKRAFVSTAQDRAILNDPGHFRVYEPSLGLQGARTAYFHNAIGGYHGAKPRRFEELIDLFQQKQHEPILNILNVKYILYDNEEGAPQALENSANLGAAWLVSSLSPKADPDQVYQAMTTTDFASTAIVEGENLSLPLSFVKDSLARIDLVENAPNEKVYAFKSSHDAFAVFSEMYYEKGWVATIDDQESEIYAVNYVLRGLEIPAGEHRIRFTFTPKVVALGSGIQLVAIVLLLLLIAGSIWQSLTQKQQG
ncbi:MAG: YfhO family protein [Candidatus Arcticimaribacter sp.]